MPIIKVKDRYGRTVHVKTEDLEGSKIQLRLYHPSTKKPFTWEEDGHVISIHRANICVHPQKEFVEISLLGDNFRICPACAGPKYFESLGITLPQKESHEAVS